MSDGLQTGKLADSAENQIASDLSPSLLIAGGMSPGQGRLEDKNIAWSVCRIGEDTPKEIPFLFSKNMTTHELKGSKAPNALGAATLSLDYGMSPLGGKSAVWVTRGGGVFRESAKYLTDFRVMGDVTNTVTVWNCGK